MTLTMRSEGFCENGMRLSGLAWRGIHDLLTQWQVSRWFNDFEPIFEKDRDTNRIHRCVGLNEWNFIVTVMEGLVGAGNRKRLNLVAQPSDGEVRINIVKGVSNACDRFSLIKCFKGLVCFPWLPPHLNLIMTYFIQKVMHLSPKINNVTFLLLTLTTAKFYRSFVKPLFMSWLLRATTSGCTTTKCWYLICQSLTDQPV